MKTFINQKIIFDSPSYFRKTSSFLLSLNEGLREKGKQGSSQRFDDESPLACRFLRHLPMTLSECSGGGRNGERRSKELEALQSATDVSRGRSFEILTSIILFAANIA